MPSLSPHTGTLPPLFPTEVVAPSWDRCREGSGCHWHLPLWPSLREAVGVEGRELSEELALNSSELRLSEASLRPLLMELLSSQL